MVKDEEYNTPHRNIAVELIVLSEASSLLWSITNGLCDPRPTVKVR